MRRVALFAGTVWLFALLSIVVFAILWRIGFARPHAAAAVMSLVTLMASSLVLLVAALWRAIRGPSRLRAIGWLLVGISPVVWIVSWFTWLAAKPQSAPWVLTPTLRISGVYAASMFELDAMWRYPRWTAGRHVVLLDKGETRDAERLVGEMDEHVERMAKLLGQPVPDVQIRWVRGPVFNQDGRAAIYWALCGQPENPPELTSLDRHEVAHTVITALAGPDQDIPSLLAEGWAESQSADRDEQISDLATRYTAGRVHTLDELVAPEWYGRSFGPVYSQGGPLVDYLIDRYGGEAFFRLYKGVRRPTFKEDFERIVGESWANVESDFWKWLVPEAAKIEADQPTLAEKSWKLEFDASVNQADWKALVDAYRKGGAPINGLPRDAAFVIEMERTVTEAKTPNTPVRMPAEFRAVFEGDSFWVYDRYFREGTRVFVATPERKAITYISDAGELQNASSAPIARYKVVDAASDKLALYRYPIDPGYFLPLDDEHDVKGTWRIQRIERPGQGTAENWKVAYTMTEPDDEHKETEYKLELNGTQQFCITRETRTSSELRAELLSEYQRIGGVYLPSTRSGHWAGKDDQVETHQRLRLLTETEQRGLKEQVEAASQHEPTPPHGRLRRTLLGLGIAVPLCGFLLLVFTRRAGLS